MTSAATGDSAVRRLANWLFRDRSTGRIVVAQWPNLPLWVFIAATAARLLARPHGLVGAVVSVIAAASIGWWAIDELARGVNPFRRIIGGVVLVSVVASLSSR